jgi:protein-tyrosine phosphatase
MIRVLFVCLGNICRSPIAEGLFLRLIEDAQLKEKVACDSAGTNSYHIGELPDVRMRTTARSKGIELQSRARAFKSEDAHVFDYILCMDEDNLQMARSLAGIEREGQFFLMRHFDPEAPDAEVPDPWYGDMNGFVECYHILDRSTRHFFDFLRKRHQL